MAKQISTTTTWKTKIKIKRKGINAKTKSGKIKGHKNYKKLYRGQGR